MFFIGLSVKYVLSAAATNIYNIRIITCRSEKIIVDSFNDTLQLLFGGVINLIF